MPLETITGTPDHTYGIGRCGTVAGGHGVTWKHKTGASLANVRCPQHGYALSQTTRNWKGGYEWTVIPPAQIAEIAKAANDAKRDDRIAKKAAGDYTALRDLKPGQLYVVRGQSKTVISGKVIEVEKVGSKTRVTVSRTYSDVVTGNGWYLQHRIGDEYVRRAESLTHTFESPSSTLVITGEKLTQTWSYKTWTVGIEARHGREAEPFAGWAVEQPQCVVELWASTVRRLREQLSSSTGVSVVRYSRETDENYKVRLSETRKREATRRSSIETQLEKAEERLLVHTGSVSA